MDPIIIVCCGAHASGVREFVKLIVAKTGAIYIDSTPNVVQRIINHYDVSIAWLNYHWYSKKPLHRFAPRNTGCAELHARTPLAVVNEVEREISLDYASVVAEALAKYTNITFRPHVVVLAHAETVILPQLYDSVIINVFRAIPTTTQAHVYVRNSTTIVDLQIYANLIIDFVARNRSTLHTS